MQFSLVSFYLNYCYYISIHNIAFKSNHEVYLPQMITALCVYSTHPLYLSTHTPASLDQNSSSVITFEYTVNYIPFCVPSSVHYFLSGGINCSSYWHSYQKEQPQPPDHYDKSAAFVVSIHRSEVIRYFSSKESWCDGVGHWVLRSGRIERNWQAVLGWVWLWWFNLKEMLVRWLFHCAATFLKQLIQG